MNKSSPILSQSLGDVMKKIILSTLACLSFSACNSSNLSTGDKISNAVGIASIVGAGVSAARGDYNTASQILQAGSNSMSQISTSQRPTRTSSQIAVARRSNTSSSGSNASSDASGSDSISKPTYANGGTGVTANSPGSSSSGYSSSARFTSSGNCKRDKENVEAWMRQWNAEGNRITGLCNKTRHIVVGTRYSREFLEQCSVYDPTGKQRAAFLNTENGAERSARQLCS